MGMRVSIELEGGALGRLRRVEGAMERAGLLAAYRAAETYHEAIRDWIDAGRSFKPRSGQLEQSIDWIPVRDGAEVYAQAEYAPYVEFGTRAHVIRPRQGRKALRWTTPDGQSVIRRAVRHPGTRPLPFFFADREARSRSMLEAAREAVAEVMAEALG